MPKCDSRRYHRLSKWGSVHGANNDRTREPSQTVQALRSKSVDGTGQGARLTEKAALSFGIRYAAV
jgi:hypothetical protein